MPFSYVTPVPDGSTNTFSINFDYLDPSHVHAFVDSVEVPMTWQDASNVTLSTTPTVSQSLRIKRITPKDKLEVDWKNGAEITEPTLDIADRQLFYIIQEAADDASNGIRLTDADVFDAVNKVIKNVQDGVDPTDAVNKSQLDAVITSVAANTATAEAAENGAIAARTLAEQARDDAEDAEANAQAAETSANTILTNTTNAGTTAVSNITTARDNALSAVGNAETTSVANVGTSETTALNNIQTARTNAETSMTSSVATATTAKDNAEAAEVKAQKWADEAEDVIVETGKYSAKHWAQKAADVVSAGSSVVSVNSKTGTIVLNPDDLDDTATTNKFFKTSTTQTITGHWTFNNAQFNVNTTASYTMHSSSNANVTASNNILIHAENDINVIADNDVNITTGSDLYVRLGGSPVNGILKFVSGRALEAELPVVPNIATQAEAEAGTNTTDIMTPQRTKQAIDALASGVILQKKFIDLSTGYVSSTSNSYAQIASTSFTPTSNNSTLIVEYYSSAAALSGTARAVYDLRVDGGTLSSKPNDQGFMEYSANSANFVTFVAIAAKYNNTSTSAKTISAHIRRAQGSGTARDEGNQARRFIITEVAN